MGDRSRLGVEAVRIRAAEDTDAAALAAIYGHHVTHGLGTFEESSVNGGDDWSPVCGAATWVALPRR